MNHSTHSTVKRGLTVTLVLIFLALLVLGWTAARRLNQHLLSAQMALGQLEAVFSSGTTGMAAILENPEHARQIDAAILTLDHELESIDKLVAPFLPMTAYLGWLPGIGDDLQAAPHLLPMARHTTQAARSLSSALLPLFDDLGPQPVNLQSLGPALTVRLQEAQPQIVAAGADLDRAKESRSRFDASRLSPKTRSILDRFDQAQPLINGGINLLIILPELLGADGPKTYLILAQNNHELRATGGFISGVGILQVDHGQVVHSSFQDSYTIDNLEQPHPLAPEAIRHHMGAELLMLRDANWWPDFPTSAREVIDLYLQDQGVAVDGVIAVDLSTLQLLLAALGPISVPGYDQPVTSTNLMGMIATYWQSPRLTAEDEGADWWIHRKDLAADLLAQLVPTITEQATAQELAGLAHAMTQALRQRHLLIYVNSHPFQTTLREMGWDGALRTVEDDAWMVVDSNVGFNKVNPNIVQTLDYTIELDATGWATSTLILSYAHRIQRPGPACVHESRYGDRYQDLMERCYWDHIRVYLPLGSNLVEVVGIDGLSETYQEDRRMVVAFSMALNTGEARQIRLIYHPPLASQPGEYRLFVQKQPGTQAIPIRVRLILPVGAQPMQAQPAGLAWLGDSAVWQSELSEDREFRLTWR